MNFPFWRHSGHAASENRKVQKHMMLQQAEAVSETTSLKQWKNTILKGKTTCFSLMVDEVYFRVYAHVVMLWLLA